MELNQDDGYRDLMRSSLIDVRIKRDKYLDLLIPVQPLRKEILNIIITGTHRFQSSIFIITNIPLPSFADDCLIECIFQQIYTALNIRNTLGLHGNGI